MPNLDSVNYVRTVGGFFSSSEFLTSSGATHGARKKKGIGIKIHFRIYNRLMCVAGCIKLKVALRKGFCVIFENETK